MHNIHSNKKYKNTKNILRENLRYHQRIIVLPLNFTIQRLFKI